MNMTITVADLRAGRFSRGRHWIINHLSHHGDECLIWPFNRDTQGRAQVPLGGKLAGASRVICEIIHGPPPTPEHHAAHNCGMGHKACVNPKHIVWKTPSANQLDKLIHGTMGSGKGSRTKLPLSVIVDIRSNRETMTYKALCEKHNLPRSTVKYWITTDHDPATPSTNPIYVRRRERKSING